MTESTLLPTATTTTDDSRDREREESYPPSPASWFTSTQPSQLSQSFPNLQKLAQQSMYRPSIPSISLDDIPEYLHRFAIALVPSFLQHLVDDGYRSEPAKLHAIAALDGLRGWACMLVFNYHFFFTYTYKPGMGWGFGQDNWGIHQLPIIHMLFSGHVMVAIFFVISGYVLSHKPLKTIRSQSWDQVFQVLASSTFRRALRLYIPSVVGIFLVLIAVRLGVFNYSTMVVDEGQTILGIVEQHPPIYKSFFTQFGDWFRTVVRLIDPWNWQLYYNYYNPHLWTIPVEFRSSIVLFITILAFCRLKLKLRLLAQCALIIFTIRWGRWEVVLFLAGMLLAEIDLINGIFDPPGPLDEKDRFEDANNQRIWKAVFVLALYLGSSPNEAPVHTPGYMLLSHLTPKTYPEPHRYLQSLGAILIVCCINNCRDLQRAFTNPLAQYLGKISFAFYIVHGPILHSLGYSLMRNIWEITGKETNFQYCFGFLIGWIICLPLSIWAGDIYWRYVDIPSVKFARWIERKTNVI
ncbi:hypothetical protein FQN54_001877 [Arachnomyces sp. PD_36]|nr:hypothetical protein FQN54_001877 [Arachnomyces sp. PD_36]